MQVTERETRGFQSEVKQLLQLMIHSLYSNKEIFLRELISNASDAADKLRFRALSDADLYEGEGELRVRLWCDKEQRTLTISDNGIGMSREEVIDHLGTIAKSGTKEFLASMGSSASQDQQLIGQFGVGFYSAFIVADRVTVSTRAAGLPAEQGVLWESSGEGEYTVAQITKADRGTEITLHLREEEQEFLDAWRLRSIIGKYSDHIALPVELQSKKADSEGEAEGAEEAESVEEDAQESEASSSEAEITWERLNKAQALWVRNKSEISDEEYRAFYQHVSHDFTDPLLWSHNRVEGKQEYTSLLYIPAKAPWDLWNRDRKQGLKLYVQRVFIMDDAEQFMPTYLRFVKGIIDSNDLPLNVSREILQDNRVTQSLRSACTKRVLQMLETMASDESEKYQQFWEQFGNVLKEGVAEDYSNREAVAQLLRFASTHDSSSDSSACYTVGLNDYLARMPAEQEKIYYLTADSYAAAKSSPHLDLFRKKNWEVLLLCDRIDEWMMGFLTEFKGKSCQLITKADLELEKLTETSEEQKSLESELAPLVDRVKALLGNRVKGVRLTQRLTNTPAVVTTESDGVSTQMAKLLAASGQKAPEVQYNLELNPTHALVRRAADTSDDELFAEWIELLFEQALLTEQGSLEDPNRFIQRLNRLLTTA
jgi:molecular chaperone HtpG